MIYEENVRKIAEEMAIANHKAFVESFIDECTWDKLDDYGKKRSIDTCMHAATIAVRLQAEAAKEAYISVENGYCIGVGSYLIDRGLIPAPEATEAPNVEQPSNEVPVSPDECKHEHLIVYGPHCKNCGEFVQC